MGYANQTFSRLHKPLLRDGWSVDRRLVAELGLSAVWLFNEGSGLNTRNWMGGAQATFGFPSFGTAPGLLWVPGTTGPALEYNNVSTGNVESGALFLGTTGGPSKNTFSLFGRINIAAQSGNGVGQLYGSNGGTTGSLEIKLNESANNTLTLLAADVFAFNSSSTSPTGWFDFLITYASPVMNYYFNGINAGTQSSAQTFTLGDTYSLFAGQTVDGATPEVSNGVMMEWFGVCNKAIPGYATLLHTNPFAWLRPMRRTRLAKASSSGVVSTAKNLTIQQAVMTAACF